MILNSVRMNEVINFCVNVISVVAGIVNSKTSPQKVAFFCFILFHGVGKTNPEMPGFSL